MMNAWVVGLLLLSPGLGIAPPSVPPDVVPIEAIGETGTIQLGVGRSLVLRTKVDVHRTAIVEAGVVELAQFSPREISLLGRKPGRTQVTFWFNDPGQPPVSYLVEVKP